MNDLIKFKSRKRYFKDNLTNKILERKEGFSWTVFFFGIFPMLFRKDWKWAGILLFTDFICDFIVGILNFNESAGSGLGSLIGMFFALTYNQLHIKDLLESGKYEEVFLDEL